MILFGSMSSAVWYCLVGIGLLISVSEYRMPFSNRVQAVLFQVIGTVLPFLYTLGLALANEFQHSDGYTPCTPPLDKVRRVDAHAFTSSIAQIGSADKFAAVV